MTELKQLPVRELYPHPDNPRKELGDLSELVNSIKENGVLQNLTVVPRTVVGEISGEVYPAGYTVVIGHRRLAAAKLAGLETVPCVIRKLTMEEQVRTMLMENMQRTDLTVYEEAEGFQMMLDLGDSVEEIARKSGFSQSTVRRRVKLLDLDRERFKASVERGATLQDYIELEKIHDPELKNKVLDSIGTKNFRCELASAITEEKNKEYIEGIIPQVAAFAKRVETVDYSTMTYVRNYNVWGKKDEILRPSDADQVPYYYRVSQYQVDLFRDRGVVEADIVAEAAKAEKKAAAEARCAAIKEASDRARKLRKDFIIYTSNRQAKTAFPEILKTISELWIDDYMDAPKYDLLAEVLELDVDIENDEELEQYKEKFCARLEGTPEYAMLALVYATLDCGSYYTRSYRDDNWIPFHCENPGLDRLYDLLTSMGYEMSDEEKALQDGTHEMFQAL